jgi:hypothetical protein
MDSRRRYTASKVANCGRAGDAPLGQRRSEKAAAIERTNLLPGSRKKEGKKQRVMSIALYARVSTMNGQDPEMQLRELREYCQRRSWTVSAEYVDAGISGAEEKRPELDRLLADVMALLGGRLFSCASAVCSLHTRSSRKQRIAKPTALLTIGHALLRRKVPRVPCLLGVTFRSCSSTRIGRSQVISWYGDPGSILSTQSRNVRVCAR